MEKVTKKLKPQPDLFSWNQLITKVQIAGSNSISRSHFFRWHSQKGMATICKTSMMRLRTI
jgi:hypothetical protein